MEKYGFVYIWYDRKHKRFYIGSHWGTENDGYICSQSWMKNSYTRRPQDFKRRILETNIDSRTLTRWNERCWLWFIDSKELGKKYYNKTRHVYHLGAEWTEEERKRRAKQQIKIWANRTGKERDPWNKGSTKETDPRVKAPSTCFKPGQIPPNKGADYSSLYSDEERKEKFGKHNVGRKRNPETTRKMEEARKRNGTKPGVKKGNVPWNVRLTKENDPRVAEQAKNWRNQWSNI